MFFQGAFLYLCYTRKNIQFSTIRWLNVEKLISSHIFVLLFFHQKLSQKLSSSCQSIKLFGIPNHFQTDHLQSAHKRHGFGFRNLRSESQFVITIYHLLHVVVLAAFPQHEARKIETLCGGEWRNFVASTCNSRDNFHHLQLKWNR